MEIPEDNEDIKAKLYQMKNELRKKEKKLKRYERAHKAKQHVQNTIKHHVQDTIKRCQAGSSSHDVTPIESSSSSPLSDSKSSNSKSVKFMEGSPEVIYVPPTPVFRSKRTERCKVKGYRSLSRRESKNQNIGRVMQSIDSESTQNESRSFHPIAIQNEGESSIPVENNNNKLNDSSSRCETDGKCFSLLSSCHHNTDVADKTDNPEVDRLKLVSDEVVVDNISHESSKDNEKDLDASVVFLGEEKHVQKPFKKQVDVEILNEKVAESSSSSSSKCGRINGESEDKVNKVKNESCDMNAEMVSDCYEWDENDFMDTFLLENMDIGTNMLGNQTKCRNEIEHVEEPESQDLFGSSAQETCQPVNISACEGQKFPLLERHSGKCKREMAPLNKNHSKSSERNSSGVVAENKEVDIDNRIERRIRNKRSKYLSPGGSCSDTSSNETGKEKSLESVLSRVDFRSSEMGANSSEKHETEIGVLLRKANLSDSNGKQENISSFRKTVNEKPSLETADTQPYYSVSVKPSTMYAMNKNEMLQALNTENGHCKQTPTFKERIHPKVSDKCIDNASRKVHVPSKRVLPDTSLVTSDTSLDRNVHGEPSGKKPNSYFVKREAECASKRPDLSVVPRLRKEECLKPSDNGTSTLVSEQTVIISAVGSCENVGKLLATSFGNSSVENRELLLLCVHESGFSLWRASQGRQLANGSNILLPKSHNEEAVQPSDWILVGSKSYQVGSSDIIRSLVAVGLSPSEEVRWFVGFCRAEDSIMQLVYVQYSLKDDWLITDTSLDIPICNSSTHLFGCVLSEWGVALSWDSKTTLESLVLVDLDVTYSRRTKKWTLNHSTFLRSPKWCHHLTSLESFRDTDMEGLVICTTKDTLFLYNVVEDLLIHYFPWRHPPVSWAVTIKELFFVMSYDSRSRKTDLCAVNPITGISESFHCWSVEEDFRCKRSIRDEACLCDGSFQDGNIVAVYDNGVVVRIFLTEDSVLKC